MHRLLTARCVAMARSRLTCICLPQSILTLSFGLKLLFWRTKSLAVPFRGLLFSRAKTHLLVFVLSFQVRVLASFRMGFAETRADIPKQFCSCSKCQLGFRSVFAFPTVTPRFGKDAVSCLSPLETALISCICQQRSTSAGSLLITC